MTPSSFHPFLSPSPFRHVCPFPPGSLELALATMDERGRALEARWAAQEARWGGALGEVSAALPRLQAAVTQVAQDMQHRAAGAGQSQSATAAGVGVRAAAGSVGSGAGGGAAGQGGGATGYVPDAVSVELAGLAHDLVHAAREELRRTRDGPLPDGTQVRGEGRDSARRCSSVCASADRGCFA